MSKMNERSYQRLSGVDHQLASVIIDGSHTSPVHYEVTHGVRTIEEQQALYALGRTKPGKIVTQCDGIEKKSKHQRDSPKEYGKAVDIVAWVDGKVSWDMAHYKQIADHLLAVAKEKGVKLVWGGNFKKFKDGPHFEI